MAQVGQCLAQQRAMAAGHPGQLTGLASLLRGEPREVEGVVLRGAVTAHRDDEAQGHRVLARVVEGVIPGVGKNSATVKGTGEAGTEGRAIGPRSFSR